jgi:hypothetical protein
MSATKIMILPIGSLVRINKRLLAVIDLKPVQTKVHPVISQGVSIYD